MFTTTLPVALSGDRAVATSGCAYLPSGQDEIDVREHVVDAVRVVFDATSMHNHACTCATINERGLDDLLCGHACNL